MCMPGREVPNPPSISSLPSTSSPDGSELQTVDPFSFLLPGELVYDLCFFSKPPTCCSLQMGNWVTFASCSFHETVSPSRARLGLPSSMEEDLWHDFPPKRTLNSFCSATLITIQESTA